MNEKHSVSENSSPEVISYRTMRRLIGLFALFLPLSLVVGFWLLSDCRGILSSISLYYHTRARNIFVGVLCGVAFFLVSYKGYSRVDNIAGNLAGALALGIAFFPTFPDPSAAGCVTVFFPVSGFVGTLHLACAVLFFLVLSFISIRLFTRTDLRQAMTPQKRLRNRLYIACGTVMIVCIVLIALYMMFLQKTVLSRIYPVFWLESTALAAFGVSWLIKGEVLLTDH